MNQNYLYALMQKTPANRVHNVVLTLTFAAYAAEELLAEKRESETVRMILENFLMVAAYENAGEGRTLDQFIRNMEMDGTTKSGKDE